MVFGKTILPPAAGGFFLLSSKVRFIIRCINCDKPRCVFSPKKVQAAKMPALINGLDQLEFQCGEPLFPEGFGGNNADFYDQFIVNQNLGCSHLVSLAYYSRPKTKLVCSVCAIDISYNETLVSKIIQ